MVFFLIFFFQFIALILQTVGIHGSGYCGFITAVDQFDGSPSGIFFGILALVVACSFAVCAGGSFLLITKVFEHRLYNLIPWFIAKYQQCKAMTSFGSLVIDEIVFDFISFRI